MKHLHKLNDAIDSDLRVPSDMIPRCPKCGAEMEPWVRSWVFLEGKKYREEHSKLNAFLKKNMNKNPNLYVFSAHLHMDEATPHLHIDFVPFTTGSKRGLDTRVSLKQALAKQGLMSAKTYKNKLAEPLVQKLKSLVKTALIRCFEAYDSYYRLNITNSNLHRENERLTKTNEKLAGENENLRAENKNYKLLKKAFGSKQMDSLLEQAKAVQQSKQRGKHFRNNQEER